MGKTLLEAVSATVEQSRRKANMVAQGDRKFGPQRLTPESLQTKKISVPYFKANLSWIEPDFGPIIGAET